MTPRARLADALQAFSLSRFLPWAVGLALSGSLSGCGSDAPMVMPPLPPDDPVSQCAAKTLPLWSRKAVGAGGAVSFNEVMYHPAGDPRLEWLEIYTPLAINVDLSGFRIEGAVRYTFPPGTFIAGRGFLVVAADADLLAKSAGAPLALGSYTGQLPDQGGTLELWNNAGRRLDLVSFDDQEPWPVLPGGSGASLAKRTPTAPSEDAESWTASAHQGGTPGQANLSADLPPAVTTLVPAGATWRYLVPGAAPPAAWTSASPPAAAPRWTSPRPPCSSRGTPGWT